MANDLDPPEMPEKKSRVPMHEFEQRLRAVEVLMLKSTARVAIEQFAKSKWNVEPETVQGYMRRVRDQWQQEWLADPDRIELRNTAIRSLQQARAECWMIIHATRLKDFVDPTDPKKKIKRRIYVYMPKERIAAIKTLTTVERELGKIGGYSQPGTLIDPAVPVAQPMVLIDASVRPNQPKPAGFLAAPGAFTDYFDQAMALDAEVIKVDPEPKS